MRFLSGIQSIWIYWRNIRCFVGSSEHNFPEKDVSWDAAIVYDKSQNPAHADDAQDDEKVEI